MGSVCFWCPLPSSLCHTPPVSVVPVPSPAPPPRLSMVLGSLALAWVTSSQGRMEHDLPLAHLSLQLFMSSPARPATGAHSVLLFLMQRFMEKDFILVIIMIEKSLVIENLKVKRNFWREMIYSLGKRNGQRGKKKWRGEKEEKERAQRAGEGQDCPGQ